MIGDYIRMYPAYSQMSWDDVALWARQRVYTALKKGELIICLSDERVPEWAEIERKRKREGRPPYGQ